MWVGGLGVYPALLQRFSVTPNELNAERPFIVLAQQTPFDRLKRQANSRLRRKTERVPVLGQTGF